MSKNLVEITGFDELSKKIKQLGNDKDKKRELLTILRHAARPTVRAAKSYAPVRKGRAFSSLKTKKSVIPGTLKKSIGLITGRKGASKINPTIYVCPRAKGSFDGWYSHFVEAGVNVYNKGFKRKHKRGANNKAAVRRTQGQWFMKRAYTLTEGSVKADAEKKTAKFIQRRIDKLSN